jgi:hypothetical protein
MIKEGSREERIAILGAGISGLSLGWLLSRIGKQVTLFESTDRIGGLARTFDWHGVPCDIAPHRLYTQDRKLIAMIESLVPLREHRRNSRILMKDKVIADPINPIELILKFDPKTAAGLIMGFLARPKLPEDSFEALALNRYGRGLYDFFFEPYTKKMFGVPPSEISVTWGREKLRSSGLLDTIRRSSKTFFSTFHYPADGGYGQIADAMHAHIRGEVMLESKVTGLERTENRVTAIQYRRHGESAPFRVRPRLQHPARHPARADARGGAQAQVSRHRAGLSACEAAACDALPVGLFRRRRCRDQPDGGVPQLPRPGGAGGQHGALRRGDRRDRAARRGCPERTRALSVWSTGPRWTTCWSCPRASATRSTTADSRP